MPGKSKDWSRAEIESMINRLLDDKPLMTSHRIAAASMLSDHVLLVWGKAEPLFDDVETGDNL